MDAQRSIDRECRYNYLADISEYIGPSIEP